MFSSEWSASILTFAFATIASLSSMFSYSPLFIEPERFRSTARQIAVLTAAFMPCAE